MAEQQTRLMPLWSRVALIVIFVAFAAWVIAHLEWQEETTRSGFSSEVRHNPYYAGMLLLTQSGYTAQRLDDAIALDGLAPHSTLLLDSPALFNNRRQAAKLLDWVRRGGHLVLPLGRRSDPDILLNAFGIRKLGWNETSSKAQLITVEQKPHLANLRNAVVFDIGATSGWVTTLPGYFVASPPAATQEDDSGSANTTPTQRPFYTSNDFAKIPAMNRQVHAVYARWPLGRGYVTAGDLEPFHNEIIEDNYHASLFVRLMTLPADRRPIYVALTAEYPSLGTWLIQHAGAAILALAILLAALLWRTLPRFGPPLADNVPKRPGLLEHLGAVGDFLLREKQYEALIAPLREDVVARLTHLRSRHPEIVSLPELGAHIAHLDVDDVILAFAPVPTDTHEFQRRSRTLATLRKHCNNMQTTFLSEGSQK